MKWETDVTGMREGLGVALAVVDAEPEAWAWEATEESSPAAREFVDGVELPETGGVGYVDPWTRCSPGAVRLNMASI